MFDSALLFFLFNLAWPSSLLKHPTQTTLTGLSDT
jgi:hypothetical protein